MRTYVLECRDREGAESLRARHLEAHRSYLRSHEQMVRLAGPLLSDTSEPIGSLLFLSCASRAEAVAFGEADPFTQAGVFDSVIVREFKAEVGSKI